MWPFYDTRYSDKIFKSVDLAKNTGPLFSMRKDVLPQDLVKSRSREIRA